jgi:hypothetical protein
VAMVVTVIVIVMAVAVMLVAVMATVVVKVKVALDLQMDAAKENIIAVHKLNKKENALCWHSLFLFL